MARKISVASVAAAGAAAIALTAVPGATHTHNTQQASAATAPVAFVTATNDDSQSQSSNVHQQYWTAHHNWWLQEKQAEAKAEAQAAAQARAAAAAKAAQAHRAAVAKAAATKAAATKPAAVTTTAAVGSAPTPSGAYANNLDGWINHALAIMAEHHIPGTYNGIHRNVMRESSGNPNAINNWDSNAVAGHPSKGLLQTIDSTFNAYHVAGTSTNVYDPVANIVAACNYAYHVYGSIDNVNGAY